MVYWYYKRKSFAKRYYQTKKISAKDHPRDERFSISDHENGVIFVRWINNNIVTVASTCYGITPITNVKKELFMCHVHILLENTTSRWEELSLYYRTEYSRIPSRYSL